MKTFKKKQCDGMETKMLGKLPNYCKNATLIVFVFNIGGRWRR